MDLGKSNQNEVVMFYFHQGYQNKVILDFLKSYHDLKMDLSTLKRRLLKYGLSITKGLDVELAIHLEILINNNCLLTSSFPLHVWPYKASQTNSLSSEHDQPRSEKAVLFASDLFCLHRDSCFVCIVTRFSVCIRSFLFAETFLLTMKRSSFVCRDPFDCSNFFITDIFCLHSPF